MEPFLLHLLQEKGLDGYQFPKVPSVSTPRAIKCLAYADDVCVLLDQPVELDILHNHMRRYSDISNARFNEDKSEAIFLNGKLDEEWVTALTAKNITRHYHEGSTMVLRYLGFQFPFNAQQRRTLEAQLLHTVQQQCHIYSQRQLSIKGRVTATNIEDLVYVKYYGGTLVAGLRTVSFTHNSTVVGDMLFNALTSIIDFSPQILLKIPSLSS